MSLITVIGRGHSGTRAISHTLSQSGVYMGEPLNISGDLVPPEKMYEACRVIGRHVHWRGDYEWDYSELLNGPIDPAFERLIESYLETVLASDAPHRGWKIPETTLAYPWILRMFPEAKYIFWVRHPYDCILGEHVTDDLADFNIGYPTTEDIHEKRAISWRYQFEIVRAVPRPKHAILVRFEDFVLRQEETLARLEAFLGFPLARVEVSSAPVGRYKRVEGLKQYNVLSPALAAYDYPEPFSASSSQTS